MSEVNNVEKFVNTVKAKNGRPTGLREVFPGRGRMATKTRADVKGAVGKDHSMPDGSTVIFDPELVCMF